jgi:hypothetical protein
LNLLPQLFWPAIAEHSGDSNVERLLAADDVAFEEPLCGVVGVRFGTERTHFFGDFLPVGEVEGDLHNCT